MALTNIQIQEARVAFDRMYEFASLDPEQSKNDSNVDIPIIDSVNIKHLSFRSSRRSQLLNDISLEAKKGEMIALLGESGSGKTTLFHILERFYEPKNGK